MKIVYMVECRKGGRRFRRMEMAFEDEWHAQLYVRELVGETGYDIELHKLVCSDKRWSSDYDEEDS